jgi:precorrin-6A/cobalt-precorrin-6A reductase
VMVLKRPVLAGVDREFKSTSEVLEALSTSDNS